MPENTVYLITGANKGIGLALASLLTKRPNTTVIATLRKHTPESSIGFVAAQNQAHTASKLVTILADDGNESISSATLPARLAADHGITRVDVVVANAGGSSGFKDIAHTDPEDLLYDFTVNAVGPARLFKAVWPILKTAERPRFVLISSSVGSIAALEDENLPSTAYGMSKAAVNWFAKKLSVEFKGEGLSVGIVHPGWVKTAMGQGIADAVNFGEPPMGVEDSAKGVIKQIDNLTSETSGKFLTYKGVELPW
ncbi:hypothetical protein B0T19DRAFT_428231 [Cercophora scortea]|uniref:Uncharacterized protein n=1 Tax=Cercophora scortea TaxID=314031 RepID=A0AAE0IFT9_9PEZI|nr:hypothetical protein B0T19DRAFT_428231 [Cercophora scortea]